MHKYPMTTQKLVTYNYKTAECQLPLFMSKSINLQQTIPNRTDLFCVHMHVLKRKDNVKL